MIDNSRNINSSKSVQGVHRLNQARKDLMEREKQRQKMR